MEFWRGLVMLAAHLPTHVAARNFATSEHTNQSVSKRFNFPPTPGKVAGFAGWAALGDSYSAGPGVGILNNPTDPNPGCFRKKNAYAPMLQASALFAQAQPIGSGRPDFDFLACTGDKIPEAITQADDVADSQKMVTLSIGGNDVLFADIVKRCFIYPGGGCTTTLNSAFEALYSTAFSNNFNTLLVKLVDRLNFCAAGTANPDFCRTSIFQTGYPSFFVEYTNRCDALSFTGVGALITKSKRRRINQGVQELNLVLQYHSDRVNHDRRQGAIDPIKFVDQGYRYADHRFCRPGVTEPTMGNTKTWFFHILRDSPGESSTYQTSPDTTSQDAYNSIDASCYDRPSTDMADAIRCAFARAIQIGQNPCPDGCIDPEDSERLSKPFHPIIPGYRATQDELMRRLKYRQPAPPFYPGNSPAACGSVRNLNLRIAFFGDSITKGFPPPTYAQGGYRENLYHLLTTPGDLEDCDPPNSVQFVGTFCTPGLADDNGGLSRQLWSPHDGINAATLSQIQAKVERSGTKSQNPNVILLLAGTNDILIPDNSVPEGYVAGDLDAAANAFSSLLQTVYDNRGSSNPAIIVAHIPLFGRSPAYTSGPLAGLNRRVTEYNARINRIVDDMRNRDPGRRILTVHTSTYPDADEKADVIHPNRPGYDRIADAWLEGIYLSNLEGWIQQPQGGTENAYTCGPLLSTGGQGAETPGTCPFNTMFRVGSYSPATPTYIDNGITGNGGDLGVDVYGPVKCRRRSGNGRAICRCTKHDNIFNPNGEPSTDWDAAYADEIGGDCTGLDLPYTTAVRLADIDGDGRADYLHVNADSSVLGFETIDVEPQSQARVGFNFHQRIAKGVIGAQSITYDFRHEIQFADLNGDGFADYIWTHPNGRVEAWFNAGTGWCNLDATGFRYQGQIAAGIGKPGNGVWHIDLNGDGRADYVYVGPDGTTTAYMNTHDESYPGGIRYVDNGQIHGPTKNGLPGTSVRFADVTGKGTSDYLVVGANGRTTMDFNGGPIDNDNNCKRYFQSHGQIASGAGADYAVAFGDLNGDGRSEYNVIDAASSAIRTFYSSSSPGSAGNLWCRNATTTGPRPTQHQIDRFCNQHDGDYVKYDARAENVGTRTSLTMICTTCQPLSESVPGIVVNGQICKRAFSRILDDCDQSAGSVTTNPVEYIIYRY